MAYWGAPPAYTLCGCWFLVAQQKHYLPQVKLRSHTTILATTSSTVLQQTFTNASNEVLKEVTYTFPLYDGVSVARFSCKIGEKVIVGIVKERNTAREEYNEAVSKGQTAALFEQNTDAADVFTTSIGNVPAGEAVVIDITYLGELKNDAETDGARFTIPTQIAPRYGNTLTTTSSTAHSEGGIEILVDICLEEGDAIRGIQSPSHPIAVTMGRISSDDNEETFNNHMGSSTLTLSSTELDKDFVMIVQAKGQDTPRALLETHTDLPNQRAIMTTLIPKFNLPNETPEIVFVVDRSGSMGGKMHLVIEALKVFLKSLPTSVKFNICSFGTHHSFLFDRSQTYDATSLKTAMDHIQPYQFDADYGGTEMLQPVQDVLMRRYKDLPLEVLLLTDGEIWRQDEMFALVTEAATHRTRFFTLGIGSSASSSLVEGIARAGRGFAQWVNDGERIDKRIVRMLKAALTPHIDYKLEINYDQGRPLGDDDFEIIESFEKSISTLDIKEVQKPNMTKKIISLFNPKIKDEPTNPPAGRFDHVPSVSVPNVLQAPYIIPQLFPHSRSTIYLILGPDAPSSTPKSLKLRGTSEHGDLELELPIQDVGFGTTIHQLAAKKAVQELEEGRGWITEAKDRNGKPLKSSNEGNWDLMVEREAARLGTTFQVAGKHASFIAVLKGEKDTEVEQTTYSAAEKELEEYQGKLMLLEQTNKKRKSMRPGPSGSNLFGARGRGGAFGLSSASAPHAMSRQQQQQFPASLGQPQQYMSSFGASAGPGSFSPSGANTRYTAPHVGGLFGSVSSGNADRACKARSSTKGLGVAPPATVSSGVLPSFGAAPAPTRRLFDANPPSYAAPAFGPPPPPPLAAPSKSLASPEQLGMDLSTLENAEVLENSAVDSFLSNSAPRSRSDDPSNIGSETRRRYHKPATRQTSNDPKFSQIAQTDDITKPVKALTALEKMQKLIDLQTFSGFWTGSTELLAILSHDDIIFSQQSQVYTVVKDASDSVLNGDFIDDLSIDALVTSLVIAWFEMAVPQEADVWEMVVDKARGWLEGRLDGSNQVDALVMVCKKLYHK